MCSSLCEPAAQIAHYLGELTSPCHRFLSDTARSEMREDLQFLLQVQTLACSDGSEEVQVQFVF